MSTESLGLWAILPKQESDDVMSFKGIQFNIKWFRHKTYSSLNSQGHSISTPEFKLIHIFKRLWECCFSKDLVTRCKNRVRACTLTF